MNDICFVYWRCLLHLCIIVHKLHHQDNKQCIVSEWCWWWWHTNNVQTLYSWSDYCHNPDHYCKYFIDMGWVYEIQCNVMQVRQYNNVWQSQNKNVTLVMRSCQSCHFLVIRGWIFFIHGRMFKILTYFILYWLSKHIELKDITQKKMYFYFNNLICKLFFNLVLAILPQ